MSTQPDLAGRTGDHPCDLLHDADRRLGAVALIFSFKDGPDLAEGDAAGIHQLLRHIQHVVRHAEKLIQDKVDDPYRAGFKKGSEAAAAEYQRGLREGQERYSSFLAEEFPERRAIIKKALKRSTAKRR